MDQLRIAISHEMIVFRPWIGRSSWVPMKP